MPFIYTSSQCIFSLICISVCVLIFFFNSLGYVNWYESYIVYICVWCLIHYKGASVSNMDVEEASVDRDEYLTNPHYEEIKGL